MMPDHCPTPLLAYLFLHTPCASEFRASAPDNCPVTHPTARDRIAALSRPDKWFLGGLDGVVWAPPFPRWLHRPGFWDPAHLLQYELGPCFSVALLDADGREVALEPRTGPGTDDGDTRRWRPGCLTTDWTARLPGRHPAPLVATEERRVRPGGLLESRWTLPPPLASGWLVAFTAQPLRSTTAVRASATAVTWVRTVSDRAGGKLPVTMELSGDPRHAWYRVVPSEGKSMADWALSPFAEDAPRGPTDPHPDDSPAADPHPDEPPTPDPHAHDAIGWLWVAVAVPARADDPISLRLRLSPDIQEASRAPAPPPRTSPAPPAPASPHPWQSFFFGFPSFSCGDPHLDRYFDHRIHGLGLNRIDGAWGNIRHPAIAEGPEYFHIPITYSAQCHMMEMRWRAGGREAWGSILNFLDNQKDDGSLHGRLYANHLERTDFYHANWGDAVLAVHRMHPDDAALARTYEGLSRYAGWLNRSRDPDNTGMFTVVNHFETGQEYMSRYMAVDPHADTAGWQPRLRLKGIDVTVYAYLLFRALDEIARELGRDGDRSEWQSLASRTGDAVRERMWSPEARLFTDLDGRTLERTDVKSAVGFYPMLTDLVDGSRLGMMMDHLEDPATFGTRHPLPSSSVDDPRFSAEGIWAGKRRNCPWNGRVWPMTTSHVIEGLLRCRGRGNGRAGALAADMLTRFVRMMFTRGDPDRPNCYEHYNPHTGRACTFRGIDDYQHSWVLDLLARGIAGLDIDRDGATVWPLPHGFRHVALGPVRTRGHTVAVQITADRVALTVDGRRHGGPRDHPLTVRWP